MFRRLKKQGEAETRGSRPPLAGASCLLFFGFLFGVLAWREIELDNSLFEIHSYSWKYLADPKVSLPVKLTFGSLSIGLLLFVAGRLAQTGVIEVASWCWKRARHALGWTLSGLGFLVLGQAWDKGRTIAAHFGLQLFLHIDPNPVPEEVFELLGDLLIVQAALRYEKASLEHRAAVESSTNQVGGNPFVGDTTTARAA